jgi:hypothetical protein
MQEPVLFSIVALIDQKLASLWNDSLNGQRAVGELCTQ